MTTIYVLLLVIAALFGLLALARNDADKLRRELEERERDVKRLLGLVGGQDNQRKDG